MGFFNKTNIVLLILSVVGLVLGYKLLGTGPAESSTSLDIAPLVLTGLYLVVIPFAIVFGKNYGNTKGD